jgi:hypothetical protein
VAEENGLKSQELQKEMIASKWASSANKIPMLIINSSIAFRQKKHGKVPMSWVNSIRFFVMFHLTIPAKPGRQPPLVPRLPPDITSAKTYPQHRSQKAVNGQGSWRVSLK